MHNHELITVNIPLMAIMYLMGFIRKNSPIGASDEIYLEAANYETMRMQTLLGLPFCATPAEAGRFKESFEWTDFEVPLGFVRWMAEMTEKGLSSMEEEGTTPDFPQFAAECSAMTIPLMCADPAMAEWEDSAEGQMLAPMARKTIDLVCADARPVPMDLDIPDTLPSDEELFGNNG